MTYKNADLAFFNLFNKIKNLGVNTKIGTKAMYNIGFTIENPEQNHITIPWRKWSKDYAEREWQWYLSGNPSVEEIKKYAKLWDKMHGGDNIVNSNYGFQWMRENQLDKVIEQLKKNKNTRQAWVSIFDGKEKDKYKFDTPCTLAIGFDVHPYKEDELNMTVMMRSNDLVYGFCNDQYCFSKLQMKVAQELNMKVGTYYHFAHDMHIYNKFLSMNEKTK